jgi:hypothetical protein
MDEWHYFVLGDSRLFNLAVLYRYVCLSINNNVYLRFYALAVFLFYFARNASKHPFMPLCGYFDRLLASYVGKLDVRSY